jgi:glyoxylase-like metal-dependent hydrolase (beta-lactamase superfamily II)
MELCFTGDGFSVFRVVVGPLDNNVYLTRSTTDTAGFLVDAADEADTVLSMTEGVDVETILTTHGHWDHHQAAHQVGRALDVSPTIHTLDAFMVDDAFSAIDNGPLRCGDVSAEVVHPPGHTPGSVCVVLPGVALTGDTLFPGGPGATRFDHSSFDAIIESISTKLFSLDDDTVILPGHGPPTRIGAERGSLQEWIDRRW